jgi:AraC-like DNA-binding protein
MSTTTTTTRTTMTIDQIKFTVLKSCYYISIKDIELGKSNFEKSADEFYVDSKLLYDQFTEDERNEFKLPTTIMSDDKQFEKQMNQLRMDIKKLLAKMNYEQVTEIYYYYCCYCRYFNKSFNV